MIRIIHTRTAADAFPLILAHVITTGTRTISESGDDILTIDTLITRVSYTMESLDKLTEMSPLGAQATEQYMRQLVYGENIKKENPDEEAEYTYYQRLREYDFPEHYDTVDQIGNIVEKLVSSPGSRRAVAVTWKPWDDIYSESPPCMILQKFNIDDGLLNMRVCFRSHDLFGGFPSNFYGLAYQQKRMAESLDVGIGFLEVISLDGHVYMTDMDKIRSVLK